MGQIPKQVEHLGESVHPVDGGSKLVKVAGNDRRGDFVEKGQKQTVQGPLVGRVAEHFDDRLID
jgi:hypothetical protein